MLNPINYERYLDPLYSEFLKDKRIALVGPASYLSSLALGDYIDSHDLVVRVNRGMELISMYSQSIGSKTSLVYNCLIEGPDNGGIIDVGVLKEAGIEWVSTIPGSNIKGETSSNELGKLVKFSTVSKIRENLNFHIMDYHLYGHLNKQVKSRANTGFSAIVDLLQHGAKELFVTGYSFYLDTFIGGYKKGCKKSEDVFASNCFVSKRHNQVEQWGFMKQLVHTCNRIKTDPVLSYILSMNKLSREEFENGYRDYLHTD